MAIAFRAVGARMKEQVSSDGSHEVSMPAGTVNGDFLLLCVLLDCRVHETGPPGWTFLGRGDAGLQTNLAPYPDFAAYWKIRDGSEGASETVEFSTDAYPEGDPFVMGVILAWSGTHQTAPITQWGVTTDTASTAAQAHPQLTTTAANSWLITARAASSAGARTFTNSVGGDAERVDDTAFSELDFAVYDSNATVSPGLQTQRTTTANGLADYGSAMFTLAVQPPSPAGGTQAVAGTAQAAGDAFNASVFQQSGPWNSCSVMPVYTFAIDWSGNGSFADSGDDVTEDILSGGVTISYGRDQARQLSPTKTGTTSFNADNSTRKFSPDNTSSPLFGDLDPAREAKAEVVFNGTTYPLGFSRIDDYDVTADFTERSVSFTFLDGLKLLDGFPLSTELLSAQRTGDLINYILDQAGWTGGRDIDPGATVVPWWWAEGVNALPAISDLVLSEGPPSIAYVTLDNTFVFRDRHHRLLRQPSIESQATFSAAELGECASPAVTGLSFTKPFVYAHGWRDIVNSVAFEVSERSPDLDLSAVWTSQDTISLSIGQSATVDISGSEPFKDALTPELGTDFTVSGAGTVQVQLSRTSGASASITLLAVGGSVVVSDLQLRARAVPVQRTTKVSQKDPGSISQHGEQAYPNQAPWANANDAYAIASMILLHYAQRRSTVQLRVTNADPEHFNQILSRMISDRIHIRNDEMGLDADFFIEQITHSIDRMNVVDRPPVHSVVFGCEKELVVSANPFRFDVRGAGFDEGVFDPITSDNPDTVFVWDDAVQGVFDFGLYGT